MKWECLFARFPKTTVAFGVVVLIVAGSALALWLRPVDQSDILAIANSINAGGYDLKGSGVPEKIVFKGVEILKKTPGTYCCGFTFWVAVKAAEQRGLLADKDPYEIRQFQCEAYGASKASAEREIVMAMENLGIGKRIDPSDAKPGDFVTFQRSWRPAPGHSVIFLNYVRHHGVIVGVHYRSSQPPTNGVGDQTEYFSSSGYIGASIDPSQFFVCRMNSR